MGNNKGKQIRWMVDLLMTEKGILIVLSGPSGVGKGTVRSAIFSQGEQEFMYSISATTRQQREGEVDGVDYFFKTREEFERMIEQDELLEYTEYVGNYYGTPIDYVKKTLEAGNDIFLEIEVQGAMQVKERMPEGIFIFLTPPNMDELESRIVNRGTDASPVIRKRMEKAVEELNLIRYYDYAVENDTVDHAVNKVLAIIKSEHLKVSRILDSK